MFVFTLVFSAPLLVAVVPTAAVQRGPASGAAAGLLPHLTSSSIALSASPLSPQFTGTSITLTATVSGSGSPGPTGTANFENNGVSISGCSAKTLTSQVATCVTTSLVAGTNPLKAIYSGDTNFSTSTSSTLNFVMSSAPSAPTGVSALATNDGATISWTAATPHGGLPVLGYTVTASTGQIYLINRYYDPTTDQFLSIDPDVATTDQPYVFTNDDPLNAEDPLGLEANKAIINYNAAVAKKCDGHPNADGCRGINVGGDILKTANAVPSALANTLGAIPGHSASASALGLVSAGLTAELDRERSLSYTLGDVIGGVVGGLVGGIAGGIIGGGRGASVDTIECGDDPVCAPVGFVVGGIIGAGTGGYAGSRIGESTFKWLWKQF
jgi:RHS repeat-associated protein